VSVEKGWDECGVGVYWLSNSEIAGSMRNRLWASLRDSELSGYGSVNGRGPAGITACSQTRKSRAGAWESDVGG
jgi:hypothetical protein